VRIGLQAKEKREGRKGLWKKFEENHQEAWDRLNIILRMSREEVAEEVRREEEDEEFVKWFDSELS